MAVYQAKVISIEPTANGTINADVFVELRTGTNPDWVWKPATNGHFTLVLEVADVMAIINDPLNTTVVKKRVAIRNLIKSRALARGIDKADEAFIEMNKLFTFPDMITIRE